MSPLSPTSAGSMQKANTTMNQSFTGSNSKAQVGRSDDDPNRAMEKKLSDARMLNMIIYITDYMRTIIESGNQFTQSNFFILMLQLTPDDLKPENRIVQYIRCLTEELDISPEQFSTFIEGLLDVHMKTLW